MARQEAITAQYDRVAPWYRVLSPLFLVTPWARRRAVAALGLRRGDTVLEVGVGTGRNLPYLLDAVGPEGAVIGVDLSPGMLAEARKLVAKRGAANVGLIEADASTVELGCQVDAVLFSLSYSAMPVPARSPSVARAWEHLRPGGRLVVMDAGLTKTRLRPILAPIARQLIKLGPGDPYSRPWDDLAAYGEVAIEPIPLLIFYLCTVTKPPGRAQRSIGSP